MILVYIYIDIGDTEWDSFIEEFVSTIYFFNIYPHYYLLFLNNQTGEITFKFIALSFCFDRLRWRSEV